MMMMMIMMMMIVFVGPPGDKGEQGIPVSTLISTFISHCIIAYRPSYLYRSGFSKFTK